MRVGSYLRTMGKLNALGDTEDVEIALDTCAEIDTICTEFAKRQRLKPYINEYPRL